MGSAVKISGRQDGLEIEMKPTEPFGRIVRATEKKLEELKNFLKDSDIHIAFSGKRLSEGQKAFLQHRILRTAENAKISFEATEGIKTQFYRGVVRSGVSLKSSGDLTVLGDVNPGAYLYAEGSITVMGSLRGVAAAGCSGDRKAFVAALDMRPSQIRIGEVIARSASGESMRVRRGPEIASLCEGKIIIKSLYDKL